MAPEHPHTQESTPIEGGQPEYSREDADPESERAARIKRVGADNARIQNETERKTESVPEKTNVEIAKQKYQLQLKNYKATYEDTYNAITKHMVSITARIKELERDRNDNRLDKTLNSMFLAGGLLGKTVRQAENEEMTQLLKTYARCEQDMNDVQRFAGNPQQYEIDKWMKQLQKFRIEIGLPALPANVVNNYDESQKMAQETRDSGYGYDVDYKAINEGLAASEGAFDAWDKVINGIDTGMSIVAGMVPYGSEVYGLTKELTHVATGFKTPAQAAEDFVIGEIGSRIGGKVGGALKNGLFKVGGKFASSALAKKFGSKVAGQIVKEIEKRAPEYASKFSKEFAKKALPVLGKVGDQAAEGATRGAVSGAVEATVRGVSDKYLHCKDKSWFGILHDAVGAAESGAATGTLVGPIGAYLRQRLAMRAFPDKRPSKLESVTTDDVLSIPDTPEGKRLRLAIAQEVLDADGTGPGLSQQQLDTIWEAHVAATIPEKARILAKGDMFTKEQRRALMEWGVCGTNTQTVGPPPPPPPGKKAGLNNAPNAAINTPLRAGDTVRVDTPGKSLNGASIPVGTYKMEEVPDPKNPGQKIMTLKPLNPADRGSNYTVDSNATTLRGLSPADAKDRASMGYRESAPPPAAPKQKPNATSAPPPAPSPTPGIRPAPVQQSDIERRRGHEVAIQRLEEALGDAIDDTSKAAIRQAINENKKAIEAIDQNAKRSLPSEQSSHPKNAASPEEISESYVKGDLLSQVEKSGFENVRSGLTKARYSDVLSPEYFKTAKKMREARKTSGLSDSPPYKKEEEAYAFLHETAKQTKNGAYVGEARNSGVNVRYNGGVQKAPLTIWIDHHAAQTKEVFSIVDNALQGVSADMKFYKDVYNPDSKAGQIVVYLDPQDTKGIDRFLSSLSKQQQALDALLVATDIKHITKFARIPLKPGISMAERSGGESWDNVHVPRIFEDNLEKSRYISGSEHAITPEEWEKRYRVKPSAKTQRHENMPALRKDLDR